MKLRWISAVLMTVLIFLSVGFVPAYASIEEVPEQPLEATPTPVAVTPTPSATPSVEVTAVREPKPISVDGTGTVVDAVTEADGKEFYTITTEAGNVFFLIIDHQKEENNVYFLNAVTEDDLMALAVKSEDSGEDSESAVPTAAPTPTVPVEAPPETENPENTQNSAKTGGGGIALIIIAAIAVGGAGYYFKIYLPKKRASDADDEYDPEYEDEPDAPDEQNGDYDIADDAELNE